MMALVQRVSEARVDVEGRTVGQIGPGILALWCAVHGDASAAADTLLRKLLGLRIFADEQGKMNKNVGQIGGGVLIVPQFTLAADTSRGTRPSFAAAAAQDVGRPLFDYFYQQACRLHPIVASGEFGATMQVTLVNDGPVTVWLNTPPRSSG